MTHFALPTARFWFDKLFCGPLLANRTVPLVIHHVDLVLPGTYYLVRMLDGWMDTQGTVKELREQGIPEDIADYEGVEVHAKDLGASTSTTEENDDNKKSDEKLPRQSVMDEHRETGGVRWSVHKSHLQASNPV
jgi:hypothetical protein